jgi:hypothetical protein
MRMPPINGVVKPLGSFGSIARQLINEDIRALMASGSLQGRDAVHQTRSLHNLAAALVIPFITVHRMMCDCIDPVIILCSSNLRSC